MLECYDQQLVRRSRASTESFGAVTPAPWESAGGSGIICGKIYRSYNQGALSRQGATEAQRKPVAA